MIRSLVKALELEYKVPEIYGVKWGFRGFIENQSQNWIKLDSSTLEGIHKKGGSILGNSKIKVQENEVEIIVNELKTRGIT